ncbi:dicarboxylate/amino acid:cation symporter [Flagellimonas sp. CMM7]|uniref:dicarboxylate/amino acid:cation symporter n=1 Tax=Flagellimonas sp. CMM7 TaxID=2654676 RepID=UPI0013D24C63|nr:dicarboxylate/amino acid:cation symporter [Flagellimonas sp. CMM7]UII80351.1 dicarboxylate/amino acid:cation symporter [Flagellimonas sp. CMM7]
MIKRYFKIPFATRVLIWMLAGSILGLFLGESILFIKPLGIGFLNLLIMAAIPLVFFNLLSGITALGDVKSFGKIGGKVLIWYAFSTLMAIVIGIMAMKISKAGEGMTLTSEVNNNIGEIPNIGDLLLSMVPTNIFKSFAEGNLIQIVVFAVLLGIVTLKLPIAQKQPIAKGYDTLANLMRKLVEYILLLSPLCLGALMAATFGEFGAQIIGALSKFIATIYVAQVLMVIIYMVLLKTIGRVSITWFLKKTKELYATTVATCSSLASLAVALDIAETRMQLPKKVYSFTLPMGAQFNKDGTSIMLAGILIFTAQAAGLNFSFAELVQVVLIGLLVVEGSSGIPGGGLVTAMLFAKAFNLPLEIVAIVGGIYRLIDMGNTTVNCMGDMVATTIVSKFETNWKPETSN